GIHAVPGILFRESLACKYMAEVTAAVRADDLRTSSVRIRHSIDRARDFVIKARPSAVGVKFVVRTVKRGITSPAYISSRFLMLVILSGKRSFRAFVKYNPFLFRSKFIVSG